MVKKTAKKVVSNAKKTVVRTSRKTVTAAKRVKTPKRGSTQSASKKKSTKKTSLNKSIHPKHVAAKRRAKKETKRVKKAQALAALPKSRFKRLLYRLNPKRFFRFLFSKQGLIATLKVTAIGFGVLVLFVIGLFAYFRRDLPDPRDISSRLLNQTTKFYDRTGKHLLFEVYGDQNRTIVEFDEISGPMKWATIAVEDKDFYFHGGFSVSGVARAAWNNVFGTGTQGGSTITQQFIKNSLLSTERTVTRKIKELILSIELERLYSKNEILAFYLNEIPYGAQEYGVEAAAQSFFAKPAKKLTIAEAAMLAALPQAPTYFSPYGENTDDLIDRQHIIIDLMRDQDYITAERAEKAKKTDILKKVIPIEKRSLYTNIKAPHFVLEVQRQLEEEFGASIVQTGGLKVTTTLDWGLQNAAEAAVKDNIATVVAPAFGGSGDNAALVSVDSQSGQVLAYVGSRNFNYPGYGAFDAASPKVGRQPGSSFKPFAYAELFKNPRWGPDSAIYDTPTSFGAYNPKNFDFGYRGMLTVRQALGESRNITAVKALYIAGVENTIKLAKSMGNNTLGDADQYGLSLVLGAGEVKLSEHTHAYSVFARGGEAKEQAYVLRVENADGEVLKRWRNTKGEQVLDPQIAYLITHALSDDVARSGTFGQGNANLVVPGVTHAVKTGTTDLSVDGWMMGYSRHLTTGVWVGNHDSKPMNSITSWQTGPIFTQFMRVAHHDILFKNRGLTDVPIYEEVPAGIKTVVMNRSTGYAASANTKNKISGLFPSWYEIQQPTSATKVTIDTISKKKATQCTPPAAKKTITSEAKWPELLPTDPAYSSWAATAGYGTSTGVAGTDDVHKCSDKLPDVSLSITQLVDGIYQFDANVSKGTHPMDRLNFKIDGQTVSSFNASSSGTYSYTHKFESDGNTRITAEVVDSVLYENSTSQSIDVDVYSGSGLSITKPTDGSTVLVIESPFFEWTTDPDASSYEVCWEEIVGDGDGQVCQSVGSTSYTPGSGIESGEQYEAFVTSFIGGITLQQSPSVSFSTL